MSNIYRGHEITQTPGGWIVKDEAGRIVNVVPLKSEEEALAFVDARRKEQRAAKVDNAR